MHEIQPKVILELKAGNLKNKRLVFSEHDVYVFGRASDCHVQIPNQNTTASRHHFILEINPPQVNLRDLGSLNGTFVNGEKQGGRQKNESPAEGARHQYPEVQLKHDDCIKAGDLTLQLFIEAKPQNRSDLLCQKCSKPLGAMRQDGCTGDYLCEACRAVDPSALLMDFVHQQQKAEPQGVFAISGYEVGKKLGEGGFGAVYEARRKNDGHAVALKIMLSNVAVQPLAVEKFMREVENMKQLQHKNLVSLYEHGQVMSAFYFTMELCEGGSAADLLGQHGGRLPIKLAMNIIMQVLEGLTHAHQKGYVHRDIKPQNILLTAQKPPFTAKIGDFGLAKNFQQVGLSGMTITGRSAGTPGYMPREQIVHFKRVTPASDVWSIGATFYQMLCGSLPRNFPSGKDPLQVILQEPAQPIRKRDASIPKPIAEVIDRALSDDINARYPSAALNAVV